MHARECFGPEAPNTGQCRPRRRRLAVLLVAALAAPLALHAQVTALTGTVVEAGPGKAIPFATVEVPARHLGVQATEAGTFSLALPSALGPGDSLRVASLGFVPRMMAPPAAMPCQLALSALAVPLPEVVVRPSATKPVRLGPTADADGFGFGNGKIQAIGSSGWQVARKFTGGPVGWVQAACFYVRPNGNCGRQSVEAPFRVRIYAADGPGGAPGTDLLTASVLAAASKKGWHEVDLTKFQLRTPEAGFYIAMEWLYTADRFGCEHPVTIQATKERKMSYSYGQSLGGYLDAAAPDTWHLSAGHSWQQFKPRGVLMDKGNMNAAIQVVVQPD